MTEKPEFDLATPQFAAGYVVRHRYIDPQVCDKVRTAYHESGNMFYLGLDYLSAFGPMPGRSRRAHFQRAGPPDSGPYSGPSRAIGIPQRFGTGG